MYRKYGNINKMSKNIITNYGGICEVHLTYLFDNTYYIYFAKKYEEKLDRLMFLKDVKYCIHLEDNEYTYFRLYLKLYTRKDVDKVIDIFILVEEVQWEVTECHLT